VPDPIIHRFGEGETVTDRPDRTIRILCAHELLDLTWTRYEPGERGPDPHVHHRHVDAFYVLGGELVFGLGPEVEWMRAPAGTFVAAPPDVVHTFANESSERAFFLNMHAPSTGFADDLRGLGTFDTHDPPPDGGRPLSEAIFHLPGGGEPDEDEERFRWIKAELTQISVIEFEVAPGWGVPAHRHDDHVDAFFVLDGEVEFLTGSDAARVETGALMAALPGATHGISVVGSGRSRLLNVHAPDAGFVASHRHD
jgi:quercetin dioxygenase-like cupin family protein